MSDKQCRRCRYWQPRMEWVYGRDANGKLDYENSTRRQSDEDGTCKRNPPTLTTGSYSVKDVYAEGGVRIASSSSVSWPKTDGTDWCGEWTSETGERF